MGSYNFSTPFYSSYCIFGIEKLTIENWDFETVTAKTVTLVLAKNLIGI